MIPDKTYNQLEKAEEERHHLLKQKFNTYYQTILFPFLKNKEDVRKKYVTRFWLLALTGVFILPMFALFVYLINIYTQIYVDWGIFYASAAVFVFILRAPFVKYRKEIKNDVMQLFLDFFENFKYAGGQGLSENEFRKSRIFPPFDTYSADDCFFGQYEGVHIKVSEEQLEKIIVTSKHTRSETVFRGIAIELAMNKKFTGQTIIVKDAGIFNMFKKFDGLENVKLEDIEFEKKFEVYSGNQIEARYLLTPSFMERLAALEKLYKGKKIQASFYDNKLLISVDTRQDMFEPCSFFKTNLNKAKIDTVFEQIWTIFSIIHILKLNEHTGL